MVRGAGWVGRYLAVFCLAGGVAASATARAQELVPAAYSPAPVGVNLVTVSLGRSVGDVSFDPSLPIEDANAGITAGSLAYGRTFAIGGRSATVTIIVPYVSGDLEGILVGEHASVERSGPADAVARFGVNLLGAPAMEPAKFASYRPSTLVGASLLVRAPTGQYDPSKLINIGTNRWAFKPEIGVVRVVGRWAFDAYIGGWLYTDNSNFYGGRLRTQEPILSTQAHARYRFGPRLWGALDVNYWRGGQSSVDGVANDDEQSNSRVGLTLAWQVARQHGLRLAASRGAFTRIGGDFDSIGLSYSYTWRGKS